MWLKKVITSFVLHEFYIPTPLLHISAKQVNSQANSELDLTRFKCSKVGRM